MKMAVAPKMSPIFADDMSLRVHCGVILTPHEMGCRGVRPVQMLPETVDVVMKHAGVGFDEGENNICRGISQSTVSQYDSIR